MTALSRGGWHGIPFGFDAETSASAPVSASSSAPANLITSSIQMEQGNTHYQLAFYLPIKSGMDAGYNAVAKVRYKQVSASAWITAENAHRVHPEWASTTPGRNHEFAWTIIGPASAPIQANETYTIEVNVSSSVEQGGIETITHTTRPLPPSNPTSATFITCGTLASASAAMPLGPGEVLLFTSGSYNVGGTNFQIRASGTSSNWCFVRGVGTSAVVFHGTNGAGTNAIMSLLGHHCVLEFFSIDNDSATGYALRADNSTNISSIAVRNCYLSSQRGIRLWQNAPKNYSIYHNEFVGIYDWPNIGETSTTVWDAEGVRATGFGGDVFENRFRGFGDPMGFTQSPTDNRNIWFHHNKSLWCGDDALELDDAVANCGAYDNLAANCGTLISKQPNARTAGPVMAWRNIGINCARRPLKLNDGPQGFYSDHNIFAQTETANSAASWTQFNNGEIRQIFMRSNLMIAVTSAIGGMLTFQAPISATAFWDYNGYPPGQVIWSNQGSGGGTHPGLSAYQASGGLAFDANSIVITQSANEVFANFNDLTFGSDWTTKVDIESFDGLELAVSSQARGAGYEVKAVGGTDLGARQYGSPAPTYGNPVAGTPAWRANMQPGSVKLLSEFQNTLEDLNPWGSALRGSFHNSGAVPAMISAWNGGIATSAAHYIAKAGGHVDYAGNEVAKADFDRDAPVWSYLFTPTNVSGMEPVSGIAFYPDGKPRASHTYRCPTYAKPGVNGNRLFFYGSSTCYPGGAGAQQLDCIGFSLSANDYDPDGFWPDAVGVDSKPYTAFYSSADHGFYCIGGGFYFIDCSSKTRTTLKSSLGFPTSVEWCGVFDPARRIILMTGYFGNGGRMELLQVDSPYNTVSITASTSGSPATDLWRGNIVLDKGDPNLDYIGWKPGDGNKLQVIRPPVGSAVPNWTTWSTGTWVRTEETLSGDTLLSGPALGIYGNFNYLSKHDVFYWVQAWDQKPHAVVRNR